MATTASAAEVKRSALRQSGLITTDVAPTSYFSKSGPYLAITRRHPAGVLVRLMHSIDGTDCFRAKLEADLDKPFPRRCYVLRSEIS